MSVTQITFPAGITATGFSPPINLPNLSINGYSQTNYVNGEIHSIVPSQGNDRTIIFPFFSPFILLISVKYTNLSGVTRTLVLGTDFKTVYPFISLLRADNLSSFGGIMLTDSTMAGQITLQYYTLGGGWMYHKSLDEANNFANLFDPYTTLWEQYANYPSAFPAILNPWDRADQTNLGVVGKKIQDIGAAIVSMARTSVSYASQGAHHVFNFNNPHNVTKIDLGLGNVANYPPATDAQAADPNNNSTYITPAQLILAFNNAFGPAGNLAFGVAKLNNGTQVGDDTDPRKILTAAGFATLAFNSYSAIGKLVNKNQIVAQFSPWGTFPITWNGVSYQNADALITALQNVLHIYPLEINKTTGMVWLPAGTVVPSLTLGT